MQLLNFLKVLVGPLVIIALLGVGWTTRGTWKAWLIPSKDASGLPKEDGGDGLERVKLSAQAQKNLRLVVKEVVLTTHWRKITLPGAVVDRPGHSDRGIPAPIAGVVTQVFAVPGKSLGAGDKLFQLKLASESFQASQRELFTSTRELGIAVKERKRLESIPAGAVPATKLLELDYQQERLKVLIEAYKQDLLTRQLTDAQIKMIEGGAFVKDIEIRMPERVGNHHAMSSHASPEDKDKPVRYEVQELKVNLGDHVHAGQVLAYVADHRFLYIEGRALKQEVALLLDATTKGLPVEAEFNAGDDDTPADRMMEELKIEFLGNTMDATGLTLPVYVPFENKERRVEHLGMIHRFGPYRPGQKVLVKVAVEKMTGVFVLPSAAVAREGLEAYVFKQSGASFLRTPVHVLFEDADEVVIANDGSIFAGQSIAHNAAAALNRALKANQGDGGGGHHHHHH